MALVRAEVEVAVAAGHCCGKGGGKGGGMVVVAREGRCVGMVGFGFVG